MSFSDKIDIVERLRECVEIDAAEGGDPNVVAMIEEAADEIERLQKTLVQYANPLNWDEDHRGIRRVWLEPGSITPDAYNGFEAARFVLTHNARSNRLAVASPVD